MNLDKYHPEEIITQLQAISDTLQGLAKGWNITSYQKQLDKAYLRRIQDQVRQIFSFFAQNDPKIMEDCKIKGKESGIYLQNKFLKVRGELLDQVQKLVVDVYQAVMHKEREINASAKNVERLEKVVKRQLYGPFQFPSSQKQTSKAAQGLKEEVERLKSLHAKNPSLARRYDKVLSQGEELLGDLETQGLMEKEHLLHIDFKNEVSKTEKRLEKSRKTQRDRSFVLAASHVDRLQKQVYRQASGVPAFMLEKVRTSHSVFSLKSWLTHLIILYKKYPTVGKEYYRFIERGKQVLDFIQDKLELSDVEVTRKEDVQPPGKVEDILEGEVQKSEAYKENISIQNPQASLDKKGTDYQAHIKKLRENFHILRRMTKKSIEDWVAKDVEGAMETYWQFELLKGPAFPDEDVDALKMRLLPFIFKYSPREFYI